MSDTIISVENLGKRYPLRRRSGKGYTTLRDALTNRAKRLFAWNGKEISGASTREEFWALHDVSFEVKRGEVVGIIGRNGAGKSTLLKILSRITEPTKGLVRLKDRVASLLEVGTGFHPELTGCENIYLNGAILGMSRRDIRKRFDEIVAFAEISKFLDTPVKHFSSGMYVRLAFAVAAHLEPEILIVDEVLAVGDASFQRKCLGKMKDISGGGRTVLFVSHNMGSIEQFCGRALLLVSGRLVRNDVRLHSVIQEYLFGDTSAQERTEWKQSEDGRDFSNEWVSPLSLRIVDEQGELCSRSLRGDGNVSVEIELEIKRSDPALTVGYALYSEEAGLLYWCYQTDTVSDIPIPLNKGRILLRSQLPRRLFNEGKYRLEMMASLHFRQWLLEPGTETPSICFEIAGGLSDSLYWSAKRPGILAPALRWKMSAATFCFDPALSALA